MRNEPESKLKWQRFSKQELEELSEIVGVWFAKRYLVKTGGSPPDLLIELSAEMTKRGLTERWWFRYVKEPE